VHVSPEAGWLPARVANVKGRPHVVAVRLGDRPLAAPFLEFDLNACTEHVFIPLDEALAEQRPPAPQPAGFIFHMSRTGSTVAGMMLRATGEVAFVGEPLAVNDLLFRVDADLEWLGPRLRFIVEWFTAALGGTQKVVFKFASWVSLHLDRFQMLYPAVPCAFMYREPVEVVSAVVNKAPYMFRREGMRKQFLEHTDDEGAFERGINASLRGRVDYRRECSYVEFVARFIGAICEPPAAAYAADRSILPVGYATFKQQVIEELAPAYGLEIDERERQQMLDATRHNVKVLDRRVEFQNDSTLKRLSATPLMRELCDRYIQPSVDILMGKA
jgi:hypothetical protein